MKLEVGQYVVAYGYKVKNDNDIYIVKAAYDSGSYCLYKVKINGEESKTKYRILFINPKDFLNSELTIKVLNGVEDLKQAKNEVNNFVNGVESKEIVVSYSESSNKEFKSGDIVQLTQSIQTTKSIYAMPKGSIYKIEITKHDSVIMKRLGKKGQVLSSLTGTFNIISFSLKTFTKMFNEGFIIVLDQLVTTKGELKQEKQEQPEATAVEVTEEVAIEEVNTSEVNETINNDITIVMNKELNGIEIHFTDKPVQTVIESLKVNGFRWSKRGFWYAKQSNNTIAFANGLNGTLGQQENSNNVEAVTEEASYPEIEINDLDNYAVSDELQRRLHANSMFTVDYKKDCKDTFQSIQNEALVVIALTDNKRIIHYIKKYLQSYKKRYFDQYIKILNHKSNNPSWVVTGRGGLNASRYNKMQDRYDKYIGESVALSKEFKSKMNGFRDEIRRDKDAAFRSSMNANLSTTELKDVFTVEKKPVTVAGHTETVRTYNYNGYTIAKSWGMFRIFKSGKEVKTTLKTTDTLDTAKRYVIMLVNQENAKAI